MTDSYTFKKFSKTEFLEEIPDNATLLIEDSGDIKRVPASQVGGTDVQADLTQNDSAAPDYVKGRTHWSEFEEVILVDNATVEITDRWGVEVAIESPLELGKTYTVIWDGVEYKCVSYMDSNTAICIGNLGYNGTDITNFNSIAHNSNGEPFLMGQHPVWGFTVQSQTTGTHTLTIKTNKETVYRIDKKYLVAESAPQRQLIVYKGSVTFNEDDGNMINCCVDPAEDIFQAIFQDGDNLILSISFNGDKYEYQTIHGYTCGNENIANEYASDTGEPFYLNVAYYASAQFWKFYVRESGTYDIEICVKAIDINTQKEVKLTYDPKADLADGYLKEGYVHVMGNLNYNGAVEYYLVNTAEAVANASGENVTAAEFNALLTALRKAGLINQ